MIANTSFCIYIASKITVESGTACNVSKKKCKKRRRVL